MKKALLGSVLALTVASFGASGIRGCGGGFDEDDEGGQPGEDCGGSGHSEYVLLIFIR